MIRRALCALALMFPLSAAAQTFQISGVDFSDSDYLTEIELQEIAARYVNRPIGLSDLQELVSEVQNLYGRSGVVTARAILPPQEIDDGILMVELVEAVVSGVELDGIERTRPEFFTRTLSLGVDEKPDFEELERDFRIFDIAYDIRPTLSFRPGDDPGTTVAIIRADEPERFTFTGSLDNFGSEETGELRATVYARISSLTGWRDTLNAQLQVSEGAYSGSIAYTRPIGARGGNLQTSLSYSDSSVIAGPFAAVDIVSNNLSFSAGYSQPFRVRPQSHLFGSANIVFEQSDSELEGLPLSDQTLTEVVLATGGLFQGEKQNFAFNVGVKVGTADSQQVSETEGSYQLLFASANYARPLGERFIFDASVTAQIAPDQNLPVARLFSLGGPTTVRGYPLNVRSGDSGILARLQVNYGEPFRGGNDRNSWSYTPFAFTDLGVVIPFREDGSGLDSDQDILASVGAGIRIDWNSRARGLLVIANPMKETLGFNDLSPVFYAGIDWDF
ncbi:MAG: ShlB/FhaC/HecB family hemolysin secretion/activation protein [Pseudomonadota bacterium]